jgi:hypothetical protein
LYVCVSTACKAPLHHPRNATSDLRLIKPRSPRELLPIWNRSLLTPATPDPRPHPDFEAPDPRNHQNPWKTNTHEFGPNKLRTKRANDLFKMLVALPAILGAPRGPPGGGLLTPGLLLTGGPSYTAAGNCCFVCMCAHSVRPSPSQTSHSLQSSIACAALTPRRAVLNPRGIP